ncbi:MAG: PLP-dependent aspartate aminotransferase family protein [Bacteroidetes bacterium]|nr:PLP-dependent aspartate aminotransferase family protein [Bacteroidota bacterium]
MRFATQAVHSPRHNNDEVGAIMPPIYQTSTYRRPPDGIDSSYDYARAGNPTRTALEQTLARLEGAQHGIAFASGMSGTDAILRALRPGDHMVASMYLYGGNYRYFKQVLAPMGISVSLIDFADLSMVEKTLTSSTRVIWAESPTNPLCQVIDLAAIADRGHSVGATVVVDNTFASPYLQQPLSLGVDVVLHSTTKYLGGHSDLIGGFVCTNDDEWAEHLRLMVKSVGAIPGPMDCYLVLRGTKTLHVRMERHCKNAHTIATYLEAHPKVERVIYPGLESDLGHAIATKQMSDYGGMMAVHLNTKSAQHTSDVLHECEIFSFAESLGGVESLIGHPATMSHGALSAEERANLGIRDSTVRLSVGIEDSDDLLEDLERAFRKI